MNNRQRRQFDMLVRVRDFGAAHPEWFPEASVTAQVLAALTASVAELTERAVAELSLRREGTLARSAARASLVGMMEAVSRTARIIQADDPGFPNSFHMPERQSAQALLTCARLFARDAEPEAARFITYAMPQTFAADLTRALTAYELAVRGRESGMGETAATRASIEAAIASGLGAARRLDVLVANQVREHPIVLAEWERARLIGPRRNSISAAAPAPGAKPPVSEPEAA